MIIWRGREISIFAILFGCLLISDATMRLITGDANYYAAHGLPKLAGFVVAAAIVYWMRPWLTMRGSKDGDLFFIPARFWPGILVILGIVFMFVPA